MSCRLVLLAVVLGAARCALAADAFYAGDLGQSPEVTVPIPVGSGGTTLTGVAAAAFDASAIRQAWRTDFRASSDAVLANDTTPDDAFDGTQPPPGLLLQPLRNADGTIQSWFVTVAASNGNAHLLELVVGSDTNGDGLPQADEVLCRVTTAQSYDSARCRLSTRNANTKPLWAFAHVIGGSGELHDPVHLSLSTADFRLAAQGDKVSADARTDFVATGTTAGNGVNVTFDYRAPVDMTHPRASQEVGGLLLTDANKTLATATLVPLRLDMTPVALPGQPYALSSHSDWFDEVKITLQPGESTSRVFLDNGGQDVLDVAMVGFNASVTTWRENSPAASATSLGSADLPPPDTLVVTVDPQSLPGAPNFAHICQGCGQNLLIGPGRQRFLVTNTSVFAVSVRLKARLSLSVDFATPPPPGLYALNGNFYNPLRSGDGLFLETVGGAQLVYWYTFDASGNPIWYVASNTPVEAHLRSTIDAPLYRVDVVGGQRVVTSVGHIVLTKAQGDTDDLMFSWNIGGDFGTNREVLAAADGCATIGANAERISGHWYDAAAPGWGTNLLGLGASTAGGLYFYDSAGHPRWLFGDYANTANAGYKGMLYQFQNGACPTCAYPAAGPNHVQAGSATLAFLNDGSASFDASATLIAPLQGGFTATNEKIARATPTRECAAP